jgi:hypothetical protein
VLGAFALGAASSSGETSLLLDIGFGIRYVPPSFVTVPEREYLRISAPDLGPLQWQKSGQPIAGATSATLILPAVTSSDAGTYYAVYTSQEMAGRGTQSLILGVGPVPRLLNLSTRAQIGSGEKTFIAGFVVANPNGKKIIIRAIGPSLAQFGITAPLAQPAIAIFDKDGKPYSNGYVYPLYVGAPTYETDLADSLARAGAFPLSAGTKDVVNMQAYLPGSYTVHVTSVDGGTGTVLLEIYEVP